MSDPATDRLQRYLARRRPFEVLAWVAFYVVQATANTVTAAIEQVRYDGGAAGWEVATWEFSSNGVALLLVAAVVWVLNRWPLTWPLLRRNLPLHVLASLGYTALHVGGMVGVRKLVYAALGERYVFGPLPRELLYEAVKDVRAYASVVAVLLAYRLLLWRLQGEARWLAAPDGTPPPAPQQPAPPVEPERFLVKKLGKEFLLPTAEIEWVQACGNYVNLHRAGHDYPLRSTLAAIEKRLDPARFVRVHRSYLVNLGGVDVIAPTEAGDAVIHMKNGGRLPCSRTHLDALRRALAGSAP